MSSDALSQSVDGSVRTLVVVFGDQLNHDTAAFDGFENEHDAVLLVEVSEQSAEGPSHGVRTAVFLSAMRHFALELMERGRRVRYVKLDDARNEQSFKGEIEQAVGVLKPERLVCVRPGDWRVYEEAESWAERFGLKTEILEDRHFYCTPEEFGEWAEGRKSLTMEYFYRQQRKTLGLLMDGDQPEGGDWNYDKQNRESFKSDPGVRVPYTPRVNDVTREVIAAVKQVLPDLPGRLDEETFIWPVTHDQAMRALEDFIEHRLADFGAFEDAMWTGEPFLYHSLLSVPLNLHLLDPRLCVKKAVEAYEAGKAPLNSVEGFVRQLIGWREYIRGVYWHEGPDYRDRNYLGHEGGLPGFYWDGETDMRCMSECLKPVLEHAWSHHIPRLMVLSNFALLAGVEPRALGDWFYGMYADSVDWVTTPNTIGMGLHADGVVAGNGRVTKQPVVGTKPYAGSGKYISRMSNFCKACKYDVKKRTGEDACPFNTLYWDFLIRHEGRFKKNHRMAMIMKDVEKMDREEKVRITVSARNVKDRFGVVGGGY